MSHSVNENPNWNIIYKLGAAAAIGTVLVGILEIAITFLPGGNASPETALNWFQLFQQSPFMGLRNLGLLNIFLNLLGILAYFALYAAHRKTSYQPLAGLAALIFFIGTGTFFATNRAFAMLDLSRQYAAATSEVQQAIFLAAGQAMLSVSTSHSSGTFMAFFFVESAGVLISFVMLRAKVFSKAAAFAGMLGFSLLLIYEAIASFSPGVRDSIMFLAMVGGLLSMVWYILIARRLFQLRTYPKNS